ncbi:MAG: hypothetical protein QOJ69_2150 [Actinomycetota bacterium]|jgi:FkbM family methyltransferase|nr:hypothetical protein [Actinomycetota bacterium]
MDSRLPELARWLSRPLTVVDVGCRWGPQAVWLELPGARVIGFDPDEDECRRLTELAGGSPAARFVPVTLGAEPGPAVLYVTAEPACSSLYPPDVSLLTTRESLDVIAPTAQLPVELQRLDDWTAAEGVDRVDYLKLDTQGSELDVLRGATRTLASVRAVEVEVEFNPIYEGQPLFADVDRFLRRHGFVLWRLAHLAHYGVRDGSSNFETHETHWFDSRPAVLTGGGGQLYWADAFYVRREVAFPPESVSWGTAATDVLVTGTLGFSDLAHQAAVRAAGAPPEVDRLLREL